MPHHYGAAPFLLLEQLHAVQDSQRGALKDLRRKVDSETLGVLNKVRALQTAAGVPLPAHGDAAQPPLS